MKYFKQVYWDRSIMQAWDSGIAFLSSFFNREAFRKAFMKSSPFAGYELLEFSIVLVLIFFVFWLVYRKRKNPSQGFLNTLLYGLIAPVTLWILSFIGGLLWVFTTHRPGVWFSLLSLSIPWIILTRVISSILQFTWAHRWNGFLDKTFSICICLIYTLWVTGMGDIVLHYLELISIPIGGSNLTLFNVLTGIIWVGVIAICMLWIARILEGQIMKMKNIDLNLRFVIVKSMKSIAVVLSILIALPMVGINLTVLSVFGGAIGVGIGFGLQTIASNYISGFIILLDRSIHVGDRLVINDFSGYVEKITARFVVLRSTSGSEALVPNETFISQMVINESFSSASIRRSVQVGVSYQSDLDLALNLMKDIVQQNERIDRSYPIDTLIIDFADSSINLEVRFWIKNPEKGITGLESNIRHQIWKRFAQEGIEFPFPQREIRILNEEFSKKKRSKPKHPYYFKLILGIQA